MSIKRRGGALLAVLWLSAALAAIAFSLAATVRGETERTSTQVDSLRSYYLASGAVERAILYVLWGQQYIMPDGRSRYFQVGTPVLHMDFPTGVADVEIIPETAKMNVNAIRPTDLLSLLVNLGVDAGRASEITLGIVDWRSPLTGPAPLNFSPSSSFPVRHASLEELEELLLIRGITPDLFYGTYDRNAEGQLTSRGGLRDCLSIFGATDQFDINTAHPAVLRSIGLSPEFVTALLQRRKVAPFQKPEDLAAFGQGAGPAFSRLRIGGNSMFTVRATARLKLPNNQLSDLRRSVEAHLKLMPPGYDATYQIMRWYDNAWIR